MIISRFVMSAAVMSFACLGTACAAESDAESQSQLTSKPSSAIGESAEVIKTGFNAPDSAWRDVDPENTILIDTDYGKIAVELFPKVAPNHVERIKTLTRQKFYDLITFHRVIDGFMNQTGDPKGDGTGNSELPDLMAEFTFRRATNMPVTLIGARSIDPKNPNSGEIGVGFYKSLPIATQPSSQAMLTKDGKVEAFGIHCPGVTSMARSGENTGNSQFFLMRGASPWLDTQYSIWGSTVMGREHLTKFKVGTKGEPGFVPDKMNSVRMFAELPEADRPKLQVLKTSSPAFKTYMASFKKADGSYPDICDISVPTRIKP